MECAICRETEGRFVRDHDHQTKRIRGILCEQCNSWLGVHEGNMRRALLNKPLRGRAKFKQWVNKYREFIEGVYLQQDTGVRYQRREPFDKTIAKLQ